MNFPQCVIKRWAVDLFIFQLFLLLIWLRSVFESDCHTDPKTKKINFVWLNGFMLRDNFRPPLFKQTDFFTLEGGVFKIY